MITIRIYHRISIKCIRKIVFLVILPLFSIFCNAQKVSDKDFSFCFDLKNLNGTYLNKDKQLSSLFSIKSDSVFFIAFEFNGKDSLKITYQTNADFKSLNYKGKFKKNYFEIYLEKKRIPIPFFWIENINRIRIGHDKNADLLIQQYDNHMGWVLFMAGGGGGDYEYSFQNLRNYKKLRPYLSDSKWGFTDTLQNIVIKPQYDFVEFFKDNNVSRVKKNGKWGIINEDGIELTPIKYDSIYPFYSGNPTKVLLNDKKGYLNTTGKEIIPPIYDEAYLSLNNLIKICLNGKEGYSDKSGNIIIPPEYKYIGDFTSPTSIALFYENGKYGYRTMTDIIYPPIFDKASDNFDSNLADICYYSQYNKVPYAKVTYKGESYLADENGYLYKYKCDKGIRKKFVVIEDSKIKVADLE